MNRAVYASSASNEWETPKDFFAAVHAEFHFTLDAAATKENRKCERYYDAKADGLSKSWANETVWCNPPYGTALPKWVRKCHDEAEHATVVALIPARTDTRWFHDYIYHKAEVRFIRGRLRFSGSKNSAPFPSMLVIWRRRNGA